MIRFLRRHGCRYAVSAAFVSFGMAAAGVARVVVR